MTTYLFWVTVRVQHEGQPMDAKIMKGHRSACELDARRAVLNGLLADGYQVKRIELDENDRREL